MDEVGTTVHSMSKTQFLHIEWKTQWAPINTAENNITHHGCVSKRMAIHAERTHHSKQNDEEA